jgi:hypothetical protein
MIDSNCHPIIQLSEDENSNDDYVSYGSFLLNKLPIYTEWSNLLEMLPKWMLEKYLGQRKVKVSNWASRFATIFLPCIRACTIKLFTAVIYGFS